MNAIIQRVKSCTSTTKSARVTQATVSMQDSEKYRSTDYQLQKSYPKHLKHYFK